MNEEDSEGDRATQVYRRVPPCYVPRGRRKVGGGGLGNDGQAKTRVPLTKRCYKHVYASAMLRDANTLSIP